MVYISEKRGNSGASYITLERAWLAVYCVQVSKYELPCGPRKSPQNIETIEFCELVWKLSLARGSSKLPKAH